MRHVQTLGSTHSQRARVSPACVSPVSGDTTAGSFSKVPSMSHPSSCRPWLHRRYPVSSLLWRLCLPARSQPLAGHPRVTHRTVQPFRLQTPDLSPQPLFLACPQRRRLSAPVRLAATSRTSRAFPGFAQTPQAHRSDQAEASSSSYGLAVRLLLLSTSLHGDAVAVSYMVYAWCHEMDFHHPDMVRLRAHIGVGTGH